MQPALGVSSGCVRLRNASDCARDVAQRRRIAGRHAKDGRQQHFAGPLQAAAIVAERHLGAGKIARRAVAIGEPHRLDQIADQPAAEMRVAENRAADRAGRARPRFQTGEAAHESSSARGR